MNTSTQSPSAHLIATLENLRDAMALLHVNPLLPDLDKAIQTARDMQASFLSIGQEACAAFDEDSGTCGASGSSRSPFGLTYRQDALSDYNSARAHDGLAPLERMPKGTKYTRI